MLWLRHLSFKLLGLSEPVELVFRLAVRGARYHRGRWLEGLTTINHLQSSLSTFLFLKPWNLNDRQRTSFAASSRLGWSLILAALAILTEEGRNSSDHAQGRLKELRENTLATLLFLRSWTVADFVIICCLSSFTSRKLEITLIKVIVLIKGTLLVEVLGSHCLVF